MKTTKTKDNGKTKGDLLQGGKQNAESKTPKISETEFVLAWMDAFAAGQNAAFVGFGFRLPGNQVYKRAGALRSKGVRLPFLFGERAGLAPEVRELNEFIEARLKETRRFGGRTYPVKGSSGKGN